MDRPGCPHGTPWPRPAAVAGVARMGVRLRLFGARVGHGEAASEGAGPPGRGGVVGGGGRGGAGPRWAAGAVAWWLSGAARVLGRLVPENTRGGCGRVPSEAA